jgi:hypothetical protein
MAVLVRPLALGAVLLLAGCAGSGAVVLSDPAGDGPPPGVALPLAQAFRAPGLYDLRELAVERRGADLVMAVRLGRPLTSSGQGGAELVSVLILVDTGPGGSRAIPEAPALRIARGAWNVAIRLDPWGVTVRDAAGQVLALGRSEVVQDRLVARVPGELVTLRPASAGWIVLVFSADLFAPHGVRPILEGGGAWTLGGVSPAPALDALEAPGAAGGTALRSGIVSFVRPGLMGPQAFLWLTVAGLLIFGGAIIRDLWRSGPAPPPAIEEWDEEDAVPMPKPLTRSLGHGDDPGDDAER